MLFNVINREHWNRESHFESILQKDPSLINMTVPIDITKLKKYLSTNHYRLYPFMIACISQIVNKHNEFKMAYNNQMQLGIYNKIQPSYTIFHKDDNTFSCIYSKMHDNIFMLYNAVIRDMKIYADKKGFETRVAPINSFPISCIPWVVYTGYSIIEQKIKLTFFPYVIIGRFYQQNCRLILPVTMQISHAVADGYHVSLFFLELQELLDSFI